MPRGKGICDDEETHEPKGGRQGSADQGRDDGNTTQENTPDVAETNEEPTA